MNEDKPKPRKKKKQTRTVLLPRIIEAISDSGGTMLAVSKRCGYSYDTIWKFFNDPNNKKYKELLNREKEKIVDLAENKLVKKLNEESDWAIKYTLSTLGRNRGYNERQDIKIDHVKDVNITFDLPKELERDNIIEVSAEVEAEPENKPDEKTS